MDDQFNEKFRQTSLGSQISLPHINSPRDETEKYSDLARLRNVPSLPSLSSSANESEYISLGVTPLADEDFLSSTYTTKKHNPMAAIGAKLSSTAASAAHHATGKYKSSKEGQSNGSSTNILRSKMFRQSRSDLKSLRLKTDLGIPTARSSAERSPMARTTKELDRIAALGQSPSLTGTPGGEPRKHYHHHHISFRKKDSPAAVLSSSSSNSKLASEGTVYSFHNPSALLFESQTFKTMEDCTYFLNSSWSLLCSRAHPAFHDGTLLRTPIEDVNMLVSLHFSAHLQADLSGFDMFDKLNELLVLGMRTLPALGGEGRELLWRFADSWTQFFASTLPLLEAMFMPLQNELDGTGPVLKNAEAALKYWAPLRATGQTISVRQSALIAYRDVIVLPALDAVEANLRASAEGSSSRDTLLASRILQCTNTLALLRTEDTSQKRINALAESLRGNWISRPRADIEMRSTRPTSA